MVSVEQRPQSSEPQTAEQNTVEPTTAEPATAEQATADSPTAEPDTTEPTATEPLTTDSTTVDPTAAHPVSTDPTSTEEKQHSEMSIPIEDPKPVSDEPGDGVKLEEQEPTEKEPQAETVNADTRNGKDEPETIPEEDEEPEPRAEPQAHEKSQDVEIKPEHNDAVQNLSRPTTPAKQVSVNGNGTHAPEPRINRHERDEAVTQSRPKPRRSRSVRDSFQAYYKVFKSRAYRNRSPPRDEKIEEELQRLRNTNKTYEKQLEEASDTILLQDRVLLRWEKLSKGVSHIPLPLTSKCS
jgi:hypothetical protein